MKSHFFISTLKWLRSQVIGILIAIIGLLAAAVYAAPYSPSAFGYAKYDLSCGFDSASSNFRCVRIDTTTGDSSCMNQSSNWPYNWGACA